MTRPPIPLTAAEGASVQPDGTLWLVQEGDWPKACPLPDPTDCNGEHCDCPLAPPAEFVQACAPCETCHDRRSVRRYSPPDGGGYGVADCTEDPCPDCRIELVGPCEIDGCRWSPHRTLGYAYAIGQPLPIVGGEGLIGGTAHILVQSGAAFLVSAINGKWVYADVTTALAHYGPPETLVGKWAMQLRVVQP